MIIKSKSIPSLICITAYFTVQLFTSIIKTYYDFELRLKSLYCISFKDIIKLRDELTRKEELLNSLQDKTIHWNNELENLINKQNSMFAIDQEKRT